MQQEKISGRPAQAFLLALFIGAAVFLPFVIFDGGYFIYYGDFNVQQIPFYKLAHEAIRNGDFFWNWYTDLGANFIGSYSFYLLMSPFFWLTLPFPTAWLPFFMAPLLVLKTACAALTAFLYLRRFLKNQDYAVIAALLYAFSGWMDFNIFFNHFHEPAIFFPLLLLGVEKLVMEDKKGFFALMVAINAMVNYWFFVGEVVFVMLYVFVRMSDIKWRINVQKFFVLAFEAVLGVGLAAFVLMPSVLSLMGNPRTGAEELTYGWDAWLYWHEQRPVAILQSILFPPELPARPNFFPDHGAKWSSLSAWLPMFSVTGVLAYFFARRDDWLKKILAVCLLFAMVPWLNSLFIMLNNSYYARWFYMPVLLMALATCRALEDSINGTEHFRRAIKWVGILIAVIVVMCGLTPNLVDGELVFGLALDPELMWIYGGVAFLGLLATALLLLRLRYHKKFTRIVLGSLMVYCIAFTIFFMANGKNNFERSRFVINTAIKGREQIHLPEEPFARSDAYDAQDNLLMFWHLPNIQAFHSIVPVSIMEFYPAVGVKRDVGSRPEPDFYALRPLLSVRWLFIEDSESKEQSPMPDYTYYDTQAGFNIYENENYLPMGFCYDAALTPESLEDIAVATRANMLLRAVVLEDDAIARNADILDRVSVTGEESFTEGDMEQDCLNRRENTADSFSIDTRGFTANTSFQQDRLIFFSVPWEAGWSAKINGEPVRIERANIGFMAVRVPAGAATIRFDYMTPGLAEGFLLSGGFLIVFLGYWLFMRRRGKKNPPLDVQDALMLGQTVNMTLDEYLALYGDRETRAQRLQQTLNEANAIHMPAELGEEEKTFRFSLEASTENPCLADKVENNDNPKREDKSGE